LRVRNSVALLKSLHKVVVEAQINPSGSGSCEMASPNLGATLFSRSESLQRSARIGDFVQWFTGGQAFAGV
jgi:hypothetical protein